MMYVVTTTYFSENPILGVFDSYDKAITTIKKFCKQEELIDLERKEGNEEIWEARYTGAYIGEKFYITQCELNICDYIMPFKLP